MASTEADAALLRWRLVLGLPAGASCPCGAGCKTGACSAAQALIDADQALAEIDRALAFLYNDDHDNDDNESSENDPEEERGANLSASSPYLPTWLGDIRRYFPRDVVSFMEKDAIEQRGLQQLVLEPEILQTLEQDIGLLTTILTLKQLMPERTRESARQVVAAIVEQLRKRLENQVRQSVLGALRRDRHSPLKLMRNLDLRRTVREGLRNYRPEIGAIVPERIYFYANQRRFHEWRVIVLVDQSGSMAESVVYAAIIAAIFASLPTLDTRLVFFDTSVADVSAELSDPVELLFGAQLGGGTGIARAVRYGASLVGEPEKTLLLLITDLYEGGESAALLQQLAALREERVRVLCVLALNDAGRASFNRELARQVASLDIPTFAATPNRLVEAVERSLKGENADVRAL